MNNKELQVLIFDELDHVARHDLDLKQDYLKIGDKDRTEIFVTE